MIHPISRRALLSAAAAPLFAKANVRPGCQTNAWRIDPKNFSSLLTVLDKLKGYRYQGFETGFRNLEPHFDNPGPARAEIEKRGLEFLGCHIFLMEYDPATSIAPYALIDRVSAGAAKLGAKRLILSGASTGTDQARLQNKAKALSAAGKLCRSRGLQLAYHNHDLEFQNKASQMEGLLRLTAPEDLHLVMDAGHAFRAKADIPAFVAQHHARIDGLHLRDFKNGDQVPLGQGEWNLASLVQTIQAKNWSGWIINEEERLNDVKPGDDAVAPARAQLRKLFGV